MTIPPTVAGIQSWLDQAPNAERTGDFRAIRPERMRSFLAHLPTPPAPCTVAGTKGKGSTVRLIEAAIHAHGRATVSFTSPHVRTVMERWRNDGVNADPRVIAPLCDRVEAIEQTSGLRLSWFERTFAVACLLAESRPGCAFICEVGLGGRLDATNALDAAVAVITHLSHDHREILGPTVWHIAGEKLGVARPGRPLVIAPQSHVVTIALRHRILPTIPTVWVQRSVQPFILALTGQHQQDNAATALAAARVMHPGLDEATARAGMALTTLDARCQLIEHAGRRLLIDGAHNGPSLGATLHVAHQLLRPGWTLVLGTAQDKEIAEMQAVIVPETPIVRCGFSSPRARGHNDWPQNMLQLPWFPNVSEALSATSGDVCVSGSFYLAGEALAVLGGSSTSSTTGQ
ncbi:MAG: hypothetical protein AAB263_19200 [Planctomycetota bacterium]